MKTPKEIQYRMTINGLRVNYYDSGGEGTPLLFLHGWGAPITTYNIIFDKLKSRYRVLAFDMPGVGLSDEPVSPMTIEDYYDFTCRFVEQVGVTEAVLMCHSHGGRISCMLLSEPNPPLRITKAVFMDASGVRRRRSAAFHIKLALYKMAKGLASFPLTRPLFEELYLTMREKRSSADYKAASDVMKKTMSNMLQSDAKGVFYDRMPSIKANVLLIWGENDTATPLTDGQIMEKRMQNAGLAVIKSAGHYPFLDNWPQFSAVLDAFL